MRKMILIMAILAIARITFAQETSEKVYLSTKESLSTRKAPQWYNDAKLGIFIHWGLYSVPGWATLTTTPDKVTENDQTEVRFTQKNEDLYIFLLSAPKRKSILIPTCKTSQSSKILIFGKMIESLSFSAVGDGIEVKLPRNVEFKFARMIKITGVFSQK